MLGGKTFYVCNCYFTNNYYLPQINKHVFYDGDNQKFLTNFKEILSAHGYNAGNSKNLLETLQKEYKRRKGIGETTLKTINEIAKKYERLHPDIYQLKESHFHPDFLKLVKYCKSPNSNFQGAISLIKILKPERSFSFKIFTQEFCDKFIEEIENFERSDCPKNRPNTMNNYGILMNELGMDTVLNPLREDYLNPIAKVLYPELVGRKLDSHKAFTVSYSEEQDLDLSEHYDNSEVTINLSLGKQFEGGSLYFKGMRQESRDRVATEVQHYRCHAVMHRGQHIHGAMELETGERCNLIIWMRSSSVRNKLCPMCDKTPTLVAQVGCGDGFTPVEMCNLT